MRKIFFTTILAAAAAFAQKTAPDLSFAAATPVEPTSAESGVFSSVRGALSRERDGMRERIPVIVQYKERPEAERGDAGVSRDGDFSARGRGNQLSRGKLLHTLETLDAEIVEVTPEELEVLKADENVTYISPADREVSGFLDKENQAINLWPATTYANAQGRGKGAGIGVAIIDSGIDSTHPNFNEWGKSTSRVVYSQSFNGSGTKDLQGHGTHVAGIVGSVDNINANSTPREYFWAPAMDASLINLRVLDAQGMSTDAKVISAIDRAIALKSTYNIRVMNLSLGRPVVESYKTDPLTKAVERAWRAGITVVVAAGNAGRDNSKGTGGYGTIMSPANDPLVITVGAVNLRDDWDPNNDVVTSYSSKGPTAIDKIANLTFAVESDFGPKLSASSG